MQRLGREASNNMWELRPEHAVQVLQVLSAAEVRDVALCTRVAKKVGVQLDELDLEGLAQASAAFASQAHRDLELFRGIADRALELCNEQHGADTVELARRVVQSFAELEIEDVPAGLLEAAGLDSLD